MRINQSCMASLSWSPIHYIIRELSHEVKPPGCYPSWRTCLFARHLSSRWYSWLQNLNMSGLGRYPLNIPSLSEAFSNFQHGMSNSNQRRDRLDYDDRRFNRDRDRDSRRDDDFRRDSGGSRGRSSRDRFSPEVSCVYLNCEESKCEMGIMLIIP